MLSMNTQSDAHKHVHVDVVVVVIVVFIIEHAYDLYTHQLATVTKRRALSFVVAPTIVARIRLIVWTALDRAGQINTNEREEHDSTRTMCGVRACDRLNVPFDIYAMLRVRPRLRSKH